MLCRLHRLHRLHWKHGSHRFHRDHRTHWLHWCNRLHWGHRLHWRHRLHWLHWLHRSHRQLLRNVPNATTNCSKCTWLSGAKELSLRTSVVACRIHWRHRLHRSHGRHWIHWFHWSHGLFWWVIVMHADAILHLLIMLLCITTLASWQLVLRLGAILFPWRIFLPNSVVLYCRSNWDHWLHRKHRLNWVYGRHKYYWRHRCGVLVSDSSVYRLIQQRAVMPAPKLAM